VSSEALARAAIQERAEYASRRGMDSSNMDYRTLAALARDVAALLAEVARLEQERNEAQAAVRKWEKLPGGWEAMKAVVEEYNKQRGDLTTRLVAQRRELRDLHDANRRANLAEAALAVAREREQRLREALERIAEEAAASWIADLARAALVDEPAAAPDEPTWDEDGFEQAPAAATLAEPGSREAVSQRSQQRLKPAGPPSGSASGAAETGRDAASAEPLRGRYPQGMVDTTIAALEAVRPDYPEGGAIRKAVDDALDRLYRFREIETGVTHPLRPRGGVSPSGKEQP
jgi:hypothetical protein